VEAYASQSFFIQVRVDEGLSDGTIITNNAVVESQTNGNGDTASADTTVIQSALNPTDLQISKASQPDPVIAGQTLTYTLVVANNGPAPATSVQVVDFLPSGVTAVSATATQGICPSASQCALGDMAVGGSATISIIAAVNSDQISDITNMAMVFASNPETDSSNNESSITTGVTTQADMSLTMNASQGGEGRGTQAPVIAIPGENLTIELLISNHGSSDAQAVVATDTLPSELTNIVVSSSQGLCADGICELGTIPANSSASISIMGLVEPSATEPFTVTGQVSSSTADRDSENNNAEIVITVLDNDGYDDDSDYQWQKHPVIRIDFSLERVPDAETLKLVISDYLSEIAESYGLTLPSGRYLKQFRHLIRQLADQGQVVILIDEYDHPIIDHITNLEEATKIRDTLKGFYNVIKASDEYLRFVFLTGISKFSQVGVFSGLNNLTDLLNRPAYSDALGITQEELTTYFALYITRLAKVEDINEEALLTQIKLWYNGFCFSRRCQQVYNPYSLLRLPAITSFPTTGSPQARRLSSSS
jgi:uncharacterized repeat protein (TIGR01451 family)